MEALMSDGFRFRPWGALALLLGAFPLASQEQGRWLLQAGYSHVTPRSYDVASSQGSVKVTPGTQGAVVLRVGWSRPLSGPWSLESELGARFASTGPLQAASSLGIQRALDARLTLPLQLQAGVTFMRQGPLDWGGGLDLRREEGAVEVARGRSTSSLLRPWLRLQVRHRFQASSQPFLALGIGVPLTAPDVQGADYVSDLDHLEVPGRASAGAGPRAHTPTRDLSLCLGFRF